MRSLFSILGVRKRMPLTVPNTVSALRDCGAGFHHNIEIRRIYCLNSSHGQIKKGKMNLFI
jgi:hypothetical protein